MTSLVDVNVLISAHRAEQPDHAPMLAYLQSLRTGNQFFGVPELAMSAVVRIVTAPKPFNPPSSTEAAFDFAASIIASPKCMLVRPSESQWGVFETLARAVGARGKLIPDAYFAAMAIDQGFEFVKFDSDYAKFPGFTWRHPMHAQSITKPR